MERQFHLISCLHAVKTLKVYRAMVCWGEWEEKKCWRNTHEEMRNGSTGISIGMWPVMSTMCWKAAKMVHLNVFSHKTKWNYVWWQRENKQISFHSIHMHQKLNPLKYIFLFVNCISIKMGKMFNSNNIILKKNQN